MLRLSTKAMFDKPPDYSIPFLSWIDVKSTDTFFLIWRMNTNFWQLNQKYQKYHFLQHPQRNIQ